jgi:hypothetical protein
VSTVGLDEQTIVRYIRSQEAEEKRLEKMTLKGFCTLSYDNWPPLGVVADCYAPIFPRRVDLTIP